MDAITPIWIQGGALGLAAVVVILSARMVSWVIRESGIREKYFFSQMAEQRVQFTAAIEKQQERFADIMAEEQKKFHELSSAFDRMADGFVDVVDRLEAIELKVGFSRRSAREKTPEAEMTSTRATGTTSHHK